MLPQLSLKKSPILLAALVALQTLPALAWSGRGHEIVGGVADMRLGSERARQQVNLILGGESMAEVASWLDYVRPLKPGFEVNPSKENARLAADPDSVPFVNIFANVPNPNPAPGALRGGSNPWHYVNQPLDSKGYGVPGIVPFFVGGAEEPDVVLRSQECIRVLRSDAPIGGAWGKRNALRTLVHLVGDIHQPLHVACGYLDHEQKEPGKFIVKDTQEIVALRSYGLGQGLPVIIIIQG